MNFKWKDGTIPMQKVLHRGNGKTCKISTIQDILTGSAGEEDNSSNLIGQYNFKIFKELIR